MCLSTLNLRDIWQQLQIWTRERGAPSLASPLAPRSPSKAASCLHEGGRGRCRALLRSPRCFEHIPEGPHLSRQLLRCGCPFSALSALPAVLPPGFSVPRLTRTPVLGLQSCCCGGLKTYTLNPKNLTLKAGPEAEGANLPADGTGPGKALALKTCGHIRGTSRLCAFFRHFAAHTEAHTHSGAPEMWCQREGR